MQWATNCMNKHGRIPSRSSVVSLEIILKTYSRSFLPSSPFCHFVDFSSLALHSGRMGGWGGGEIKIMSMEEYDQLLKEKEKIVMQMIQLNHKSLTCRYINRNLRTKRPDSHHAEGRSDGRSKTAERAQAKSKS